MFSKDLNDITKAPIKEVNLLAVAEIFKIAVAAAMQKWKE